MKHEFDVDKMPQARTETWPGQFGIFCWFDHVINYPRFDDLSLWSPDLILVCGDICMAHGLPGDFRRGVDWTGRRDTEEGLLEKYDRMAPRAELQGELREIASELFSNRRSAGGETGLHIYSRGCHGFCMRPQCLPADEWIERFHDWLRSQNMLGPSV